MVFATHYHELTDLADRLEDLLHFRAETFEHLDRVLHGRLNLRVDAFDYDDATGAIANRRPVITVPPEGGRPDGCTLDAEGMLWVAMFNGGSVTRWNPHTGERLQTICLPVARVTGLPAPAYRG